MPSPIPVLITLATVAANRMRGDSVWVMLIGPPGSGKTEILSSTCELPDIHAVSTINESGLLSGTPAKDVSEQAKGGLLNEIGSFGILVLKDFTSMLSMNRDAQAAVLAALREIYDGDWTRRIGADGGRQLRWHGKLGLLGGCTDAIDRHHEVIASMGDRYMRLRMPVVDPKQQGLRSLSHRGREIALRSDLSRAVRELFAQLDFSEVPPQTSEAE